jgi:tetratricopeptide (TPR) repeat protein
VQTDVTTPSLEAWRSYKAAMIADINRSKRTESISLLKRATELDPNFAMAYAYMGRSYDAMGEADLGAQNISKAFELRNSVSDSENLFITFNYYRQAPRNLELARQTLESWSQKYPSDFVPRGFLSAFTSAGTGHYETGVEEGLKALELDPDYSIGYENVAWDYIYLNRWSEAEALLRKASEHKVETADYSVIRYFIAFLRKDQAAMEREVTQRQGKLQAQGWFEHQQAMTLAYQGRLKEADATLGQRGPPGSPGRSARASRAVCRRSGGVERSVWDSRRSSTKRRCGAVSLPRPGRRLWACLCAGASP